MQSTDRAVTAGDIASGLQLNLTRPLPCWRSPFTDTRRQFGEYQPTPTGALRRGIPQVGKPSAGDDYVGRAQGWLSVLHLDVRLTLLLITIATLPFYCLGAGVLHPAGEVPSGTDTISVLSQMFTKP